MFIRVNDPPLNRNIGKDQLPQIWSFFPGQPGLLHKVHHTSPPVVQGALTLYPHHQLLVGMGSHNTSIWCHKTWHQLPLFAHIWSHLRYVLTLVSITFSNRPDEAMLFAMVKAYLHTNNPLFNRKLKEYLLLIISDLISPQGKS